MPHSAYTVSEVSTREAGGAPVGIDAGRGRWRLNRAGIVNVYQYENEVLHFGGGRLLLRGVNGSGKSTAMNMLLPFLLTARQARIDAAGEQSGILKAWMLNGRDDAQPVGYLWIEFERSGEFLVCGCGIRANRQSDTVKTWWFVTAKRPGIDLELVERSVPLSAEGLRAALDGDEVFNDRHRHDYRQTVERRLFGGAGIDQHIRLIDRVRSPRIGDRIDLELPTHLADALPQLSEQALSEAAQPLDDLEEHRRNVADLEQTSRAIRGLLDVYRSYCVSELNRRVAEGRDCLEERRRRARDQKGRQRAAAAAAAEVERLDDSIRGLEQEAERLRREIAALEASPAYREGRHLEALRDLVADLADQIKSAAERVDGRRQQVEAAVEQLRQAQRRGRGDLTDLNDNLAAAAELSQRGRIARQPPMPVAVPESPLDGADAAEPQGPFDAGAVRDQMAAMDAAVLKRNADIDEVETARAALDSAEQQLTLAESELQAAVNRARAAQDRLGEQTGRLAAARRAWAEQVRLWASEALPLMRAAGVEAPTTAALAAGSDREAQASGDHEAVRSRLAFEADDLVGCCREAVAVIDRRLADERAVVEEAQTLVAELAARTEPDPPRLDWQLAADHCLADLIDFAPRLDEAERAGIEAALQASGLLSARLAADGALELSNGELVAVVAGGVPRPLSDCLTVTVPDRLVGEVDGGLVAKLLESISCDIRGEAATAVAADGAFRVGTLRGRHSKERAEFIGVTARRAALDRARREAGETLERAQTVVARSEAERAGLKASLEEAQRRRSELPATDAIVTALAAFDAATAACDGAEAERAAAAEHAAEAERESADASNALHRTATTLRLPADRAGLTAVRGDLRELKTALERCRSRIEALRRSVDDWGRAAGRWQTTVDDLGAEQGELARIESKHAGEQARLATIEDSIGLEYAEVVATRDRCSAELDKAVTDLPTTRRERDRAVERRSDSRAAANGAETKHAEAEQACETMRQSLTVVLATAGLVEAVGDPAAPPEAIVARSAGPDGLREVLDAVDRLLPDGGGAEPAGEVTADGVRQSLRQRRDTLGAGWDAEALQPDPLLPLAVEVTGPSGRAPLAASLQAVTRQHQQLAGLLDAKQDDALRQLLQGLIAREVAEKIHGAERLVQLMNERLGAVQTAHRVGVQLRWRRSPEIDQATARLVDLLAKLPDLRTDDDEAELRLALSQRLDEARALQPDVPYRQLIAETLDYKQWHEMAVMLRRDGKETKLGRRTPLSEGEKKLVTYLPLFAAVAASCDALAEQCGGPDGGQPDIARFVLLDDAFAKVSEDNHAALFGLLVKLDLDLIATSERLWGTFSTVPEIAITEVVRDAALGVILLEHYRWDGATLERRAGR